MRESDHVRHILIGVADAAFNVFWLRNPTSASEITTVCQYLDEMRTVRLPRVPQVAKDLPATSELLNMIREIVRKEGKNNKKKLTPRLRKRLHKSTSSCQEGTGQYGIRDMPKRRPNITIVHRHTRLPLTAQMVPQQPSYSEATMAPVITTPTAMMTYPAWRPINSTPVCYYRGYSGYIVHYC